MKFNTPTPMESYRFKGIDFLLKRDDLISKELSGNKARKAYYYLNNISKNITTLKSFGSIQSNAMYSLSYIAKKMGLEFIYYANHIPSLLKQEPVGNLKLALDNGMKLIDGYSRIECRDNELLLNEGIATKEAYYGIEILAKELIEQVGLVNKYQLFLSSGTGTTSLYLSKALKILGADNFKVYTTPCVGDKEYLIYQFKQLEKDSSFYPEIVENKKKYHFGKLYKDFYILWLELQKNINVEFELLYDPKSWVVILENRELFKNLLYIHQGGVLGNSTMLDRYRRKYRSIDEDYK